MAIKTAKKDKKLELNIPRRAGATDLKAWDPPVRREAEKQPSSVAHVSLADRNRWSTFVDEQIKMYENLPSTRKLNDPESPRTNLPYTGSQIDHGDAVVNLPRSRMTKEEAERFDKGRFSIMRKNMLDFGNRLRANSITADPLTDREGYISQVNTRRENNAYGGDDVRMMSTPQLKLNKARLENKNAEIQAQEDAWKNRTAEEKAADQAELTQAHDDWAALQRLDNAGLRIQHGTNYAGDDYMVAVGEDVKADEVLRKKPADYNERPMDYDRLLYDYIHGEGAYDKRYENDFDALDAEVEDYWDALETGRLSEMRQSAYENYKQKEQESTGDFGRKENENEIAKYQEAIDQRTRLQEMEKNAPAGSGEYDPSRVSTTWAWVNGDLKEIVQGGEADELYWKINHPGEDLTMGIAEKDQTDPQKRIAMHPSDFMDEEQRKKFNQYFLNNDKEGALAYYKGLESTYLMPMYNQAQEELITKMSQNEYAPLMVTERIVTQIPAGISGTIGAGLALLGNEEAKDPNSGWYRQGKINTQIQETRGKVWGKQFADWFGGGDYGMAARIGTMLNGVVYSMADNLTAAAAGTALGGALTGNAAGKFAQGAVQFIMSSEATANTMREKLEDGMDPTKAAVYAFGDGVIEWFTEKYSMEQLLNPNVKEMLGNKKEFIRYMMKNFTAEGSEEVASDVLGLVFDEAVSAITGTDSEMAARYKELTKNHQYTDAQAKAIIAQEFGEKALQSFVAGGLSGLIMSGARGEKYRIQDRFSSRSLGADIRSEGNTTAEGKTGEQQLIEVARGMKDPEAQQAGNALAEKAAEGKKISDAEVGRLARAVYGATAEEYQKTVAETVERRVAAQLKDKGVTEDAGQMAEIISKNLMEGSQPTRAEVKVLAKSEGAIALWQSYNTDPTLAKGLAAEVRTETEGQRSIIDKIGDLASKRRQGTSAVAADVDKAIAAAKGDTKAAISALRESRSDLISEEFAEKMQGILEKDTRAKESKNFIDDAMKVRLAAMTLAESAPKVSMSEESAQELFQAAKAEFDRIDAQRIIRQTAAEPGKGTATFDGAAYGTSEWTQKTAGIQEGLRRQMRALGEIATRAGLRVNFINDVARSDINGYEMQDGSITINVASGMEHNMLTTMSHEMTHWLEQNSREGYDALRSYILRTLRGKGQSIEEMAVRIIDNQNAVLGNLDGEDAVGLDLNGAMAEIVAQSCENLLSSREMISELAQENPGLVQNIRNFVRRFTARIRQALKSMEGERGYDESISRQARALKDETEEIARLWTAARREALGRSTEDGAEAQERTAYSLEQRTEEDTQDAQREGLEVPEMLRYSMVGAKARGGYAEQIARAKEMAAQGANATEIFRETGALQGFRGNWWVSIDNQNIQLKDGYEKRGGEFSLREALEAPELLRAYPQLGNIRVKPANLENAYGAYNREQNMIRMDRNMMRNEPEKLNVVLRHEIQHAIQGIEGTYGGANLQSWRDVIDKLHMRRASEVDLYDRTVGEIEANVASRGGRDSRRMPTRAQYANAVAIEDYMDEDGNVREPAAEGKKQYSIAEMDEQYMQAVRDGDMEAAQRLVEQAAKDAGYTKKVYHGTPYGGFTQFRDWSYFTENKGYADRYQNPSASSIRGRYDQATNPMTYGLYLNPGRVFDTREKKTANLFNKARYEYGLSELTDSGLPDWTDGRDIIEYIEDNDLPYDTILLNEGADGGYGAPVVSRGISYVTRANMVKSADPVVYDDQGNVIPLSERFNQEKADIRYSVAENDSTEGRMNPEDSDHPEKTQFSLQQFADATGLRFDPNTLQLFDEDGKEIKKVTPQMINATPVGMLIDLAENGFTNARGEQTLAPTIDRKTAQAQRKMFADLMTMIANYKNSDLVWEISSSMMFSALKSNSDPQYNTTVDFGTVCAKTQEIINVMSRVMLEQGRGLTRAEVLEVYNQTAKANLTVPCPVCYVFSRWMGVPSLLGQMSEFQKTYVTLNKDGTINKKDTEAAANKYIQEALDQYGSKKGIDKKKTSLMNRLKTQEKNRENALNVMMSDTATAEEKAAAKVKHDKAIANMDSLTKDLKKIEAYNWITQALCMETEKGSGKYVLDPEFKVTPDEILFDLNRTGEFAKDKKNWQYRNTRGAGMGKAIMPYSGASIGDIIHGTVRWTDVQNPFLTKNKNAATEAIRSAMRRARAQNLIGGQRLQSTSDFRPEWGLDYIMAFLEMQAIGSKVQMYTKVAEAVPLLASMKADINLSIMGRGTGYHLASAKEIAAMTPKQKREATVKGKVYVMDFSDVTGMDYETARKLKNQYDGVQMILVGMDDTHVRLAIANSDIDFVIPWHSSGNSKDALASMISSVGERLETSSDYSKTQTDAPKSKRTQKQKQLWDLRMKILMGEDITDAEQKVIDGDDILSDLQRRFTEEGVDPDCYGVKLGKEQANQIFPYEYWDKSLKKAEADQNGKNFVAYCEHFGIRPRFSQFMNDPGYWKLLIDRPMYDNKGNYRAQQTVDVTKAKVGRLENGRLTGSDMPLKTSAMYGTNYSDREKTAVDNTLAAIREKAEIKAMAERQVPNPRASAFGASSQVQVMQSTQETAEEEYVPKKARAMAIDDAVSFSVRDMMDLDVKNWMLSMNESSLRTEAEKEILRNFKGLEIGIQLKDKEINDLKAKIAYMETNGKDPDTKKMAQRLKVKLESTIWSKEQKEAKMARIVSSDGYGAMMKNAQLFFDNFQYGLTSAEAQEATLALQKAAERIGAEIAETRKVAEALEKKDAVKEARQLLGQTTAEKAVETLKKKWHSSWTKAQLKPFMDTIILKMSQGQDITQEIEELAGILVQSDTTKTYEGLEALRGLTITVGRGMMEELKATNSSISEMQAKLAGTGIRLRAAKRVNGSWESSTLEADVSNLRDTYRDIPELGNEKDALQKFVGWVEGLKQSSAEIQYYDEYLSEAMADIMQQAAAAASMYVPKDKRAQQIILSLVDYIKELQTETNSAVSTLEKIGADVAEMQQQSGKAAGMTSILTTGIADALEYYNKMAKIAVDEAKRDKNNRIIEQMKSEAAQKLYKANEEWRQLIERDKEARGEIEKNGKTRNQIDTVVRRLYKLLKEPKGLKNVPEYMQGLAREVIGTLVDSEAAGGRKITRVARKDILEMQRVLKEWEKRDGRFNMADLNDAEEAVMWVINSDLMTLYDTLTKWNGEIKGKNRLDTVKKRGEILREMQEAINEIYTAIRREGTIQVNRREIAVEDQAQRVQEKTGGKKYREWTGKAGSAIRATHSAIVSGNMTPEYFFRAIGNEGLSELWDNYHSAENRNGLELKKAQERIAAIAEEHGYRNWNTDEKITLELKDGTRTVTLGQLMSLYATWKREATLGPEMSRHLTDGGFYAEEDTREGFIGRQEMHKRPVKIQKEEFQSQIAGQLTEEQKSFVDDVVGFMSTDLSKLGNEASMAAYGIKMYKESYYFPFQMWDGIKSRKSNEGAGAAAANDQVFHPSFSKTRVHGANNAIVIGDFMQTVADHSTGMINYATMGLANEMMQKVLNAKIEGSNRNTRTVLEEAYGREAMAYLSELQKQLNGGAVRTSRSLGDKAITLFRKNAVAGSLSVAFQQPLSYIRAAMVINPKYMAQALVKDYWKDAYKERMAHSGVSVIKDVGKFDMNAGQSAREYLMPEGYETKARKAWEKTTEYATILPELMDKWTWTRMWVAVKAEQHAAQPEMDVKSDEFLDMCGERFNEVMRRTQVYDSTLVRSENMRNDHFWVKSITSFMAEPTLTLNVLADSVRAAAQGEKGGKALVAKAAAVFLTSAVMQAAIKAIFSTGRAPDEKKTKAENFMNRFVSNLIGEVDPAQLVPGYNDLITLMKNGELQDDAMGAIGKIWTSRKGIMNIITGQSKVGVWRDIEDSVGQLTQLFSGLPAKNIMRELRAMYNLLISPDAYADRETSGAVIKYQTLEALANADNLAGVLIQEMGEAGYPTKNTDYYRRIYEAKKRGDEKAAAEMTEFLTAGKGVKEKSIESGIKSAAKADESASAAETAKFLVDEGTSATDYIKEQLAAEELTAEEARKLLKEAEPEKDADSIWWTVDRIEYKRETGKDAGSGSYYRLQDAMEENRADEIRKQVKALTDHGKKKEDIKKNITSMFKAKYLEAGSSGKIRIRDAIQKAYKALGYTAADADKIIDGWTK